MAEPPPGAGLPYRVDGRHRLQGKGKLQGDQQDRLRGRRPAQGREKGSTRPMAGQERVLRLLDVRPYRHEGPWHRGHPDHRNGQSERFYGHYQERVPRVQDPGMRGASDQERLQVCGVEG